MLPAIAVPVSLFRSAGHWEEREDAVKNWKESLRTVSLRWPLLGQAAIPLALPWRSVCWLVYQAELFVLCR